MSLANVQQNIVLHCTAEKKSKESKDKKKKKSGKVSGTEDGGQSTDGIPVSSILLPFSGY